MLISDVLSAKGHDVVKVRPFAHVVTAVRKLAEFRIGALVVESQRMRPIGIFSERDFVNAIARDGAAALGMEVHQLMSSPILSCLSGDRIDAVLARRLWPRSVTCRSSTAPNSLASSASATCEAPAG